MFNWFKRFIEEKKIDSDVKQIKYYSNRKLYDFELGQYINHSDICNYVRIGLKFKVINHRGDDITGITLRKAATPYLSNLTDEEIINVIKGR